MAPAGGDRPNDDETDDSVERLARELARAPAADAPSLERYRLGALLGRGGGGQVYRAFDLRLRRDVALKFLVEADADQLHELMREAQAQARVNHPHVCKVFEVLEEGDRPFICMQLIDGETLGAAAPRLDTRTKVSIMADVADAMEAAHRLGIVHRDLKPGNIMVERTPPGDLHAYVMDFGLARDLATTLSHGVVGTPAFMAPEQARGDSRAIGPRTDVYSLGATLYAVLAGEPPFRGTSVMQVLSDVLEREPPPLRACLPDVAVDLETIVATCMAKDPAQRYASAAALTSDLRRHLADAPIQARLPSLAYRLRRAVTRRPRLLVTGVALAGALALLSMRPPAPWEPRTVQVGPTFDEWSGSITVAPDGKEIAYASQRDGTWRIYAEDLSPSGAPGPSRALTPPALGAYGAHYSRDGKALFFAAERPGGSDIYRLPRGGGPPVLVARDFVEVDDCGGGRLIMRGKTSPGCEDCERLVLLEADGRQREVRRTTSLEFVHGAGCDAAGRRVSYALSKDFLHRQVEVLDLETGAISVLTKSLRTLRGPVFHPDGRSVLYGHIGRLQEVTLDGRVLSITQGTIDDWPSPSADGRLLFYEEVVEDTPVFAERAGEPRRRVGPLKGPTTVVAVVPDGTQLLLEAEARGELQVAVLSLLDGVQRVLAAGHTPRLSPDGREVYFLRGIEAATELWSVPLAGGEPVRRAQLPGAYLLVPARDAIHVEVATGNGYQAWRVPLDGGPPGIEAAAPVAALFPSPDGAWVLVKRTANDAGSDLVVRAGAPLDDARGVRVTWTAPRWGTNGSLYAVDKGKIMALDPATGAERAVADIGTAVGSSWVVSSDEKTLYRTVEMPQMRRMMITNFGDRPRP